MRDLTKMLIQVVHHQTVIEQALLSRVPLAGMFRQTKKLSSFIKPAGPTKEVTKRIRNTTYDLLEQNLNILRDHYTHNVLLFKTLSRNEMALKIALTWAAKRYRGRLTSRMDGRIRLLLNFPDKLILEPSDPVLLNLDNNEDFPPLPKLTGYFNLGCETRILLTSPSSPCVITSLPPQPPVQDQREVFPPNINSSLKCCFRFLLQLPFFRPLHS